MTSRRTAPRKPGAAGRPVASGRRRLGGRDRTVTPLYHQMYLVLRNRIREGTFPPDVPMPGEHQLAEQFDVSRVTVRRTLEQLELEGLVTRRRGVGTFATSRGSRIEDRFNVGGTLDPLNPAGGRTDSATLGVDTVQVPHEVAARFGVPPFQAVRIVRRRTMEGGRTFSLLTAYVPATVARRLSRRQLESRPIPAALGEAGVELARAEQIVTSCIADDQAAGLLAVPVGSPLLAISTLFADRQDTPALLLEALYRPDRFEYRTTMVRHGVGGKWRLVE